MTYKDIKEYIPHREPFLFVDKIISLNENQIATEYTFKPTNDFYKGHYPGNPITPGVITCEAVFQSAAILISSKIDFENNLSKGVPVLTRINSAKFKSMVKPGDKIHMQAEITDRLQNTWYLKGKVSVADKNILTIDFAVSLIEG